MITYDQIHQSYAASWGSDHLRQLYADRIRREAHEAYTDHIYDTEYRIIATDARYGVSTIYDDLSLTTTELIAFGWVHARDLDTRTGRHNGAVNYARHMLTDYDVQERADRFFERERALNWIAATWPDLAMTARQQSEQRWQERY